MGTYVVSGSASGIGAAVAARLRADGHTVIGVDLHDAEVTGDLATTSGRDSAAAAVAALTDRVDGVVPCAGVAGLTGTDPQLVVSLNYFGAISLVNGLHPLMGEGLERCPDQLELGDLPSPAGRGRCPPRAWPTTRRRHGAWPPQRTP